MDKQIKKTKEETKPLTLKEKIKKVNELLLKGEPVNISFDSYSGYSGYKPQYVIDAMNATFDIGEWGFEEITAILEGKNKEGTESMAVCQVKVFFKDIQFTPVGWGQGRITKGDLGDARKAAQTDAIKKALSYFSVGNRAYHGLLDKDKKPNIPPPADNDEPADEKLISTIYSLGGTIPDGGQVTKGQARATIQELAKKKK